MQKENIKSFRDLIVWQKAVDLAECVYDYTGRFPQSELYGLANQMRRAVISISSNVAEGFKRAHVKEKNKFYNIAHSSAAELDSQTEIAYRLKFLSQDEYRKVANDTGEVSKMIHGLIKSLTSQSSLLNPRKGFTLVESVVAIGVFAVLMSIAAGSLAVALRTQRQAAALLAANSSVSLALEQMARELRTASDVCNISNSLVSGTCGASEIVFRNGRGSDVAYRLENNSIERHEIDSLGADTTGGWQKITAENVYVDYLTFVVFGADPATGYTPRITISLGISPAESSLRGKAVIHIQTTISARVLL